MVVVVVIVVVVVVAVVVGRGVVFVEVVALVNACVVLMVGDAVDGGRDDVSGRTVTVRTHLLTVDT